MIGSYVKIATKVLVRRKFFTAISLFGIGFTLMVLLAAAALIDNVLAAEAPEVNLRRTLALSHMVSTGTVGDTTWSINGNPGYAFLEHYARDLPGVEKASIFSLPHQVTGFVGGEKVVVQMRRTDGAYWEILDFHFLEGGPFTAEDDAEARFVAVITESTRSRFFGDAPALGRDIELSAQRFRIVGVVEDVSFTRLSAASDVWAPHGAAKSQGFRSEMVGRFSAILLAGSRSDFPGIKSEFASRLGHVELPYPLTKAIAVPMTRLEEVATGLERPEDGQPPVRRVILLIVGMALAFLVLPTVNLVTVNLSRILERSGEIGVRKAFGASTLCLVWQFVWENVFLCLIGAAVALAGSVGAIVVLERTLPLPHADLHLNLRIFLYAVALAVLFGVLSGAFPAWRMSRLNPVDALRGGDR